MFELCNEISDWNCRRRGLDCVTFPEQKRLDKWPKFRPAEKLGENVTRVNSTINVNKLDNTGSNGRADSVVGEGIVALVEFGVRKGGRSNDSLIVTKHPGWAIDWNTHDTDGITKVHDLFSGLTSSHEL